MTTNSFDLNDFLPYQLAVAASRVSRDFSTLYNQKLGISVPEWRVLAHLNHAGAVSVREIHQRVDMDKSKVSRAATRLENRGLVKKDADNSDGRLIVLSLTDHGQAMVEEIIPMAQAFEAELLQKFQDGPTFQAALAAYIKGTDG